MKNHDILSIKTFPLKVPPCLKNVNRTWDQKKLDIYMTSKKIIKDFSNRKTKIGVIGLRLLILNLLS